MAEARRNWIKWIVLVALCVSVCRRLCPAGPGRSHPLHSIQIQSPQTGSLCRPSHRSAFGCRWRAFKWFCATRLPALRCTPPQRRMALSGFASLDAGEYTLEADAPQLGQGRLEGILITGGMEARVQAAMRFEPPAPALLEAAAPNQIAAPARAAPMPLAASCTASTRTGRRPSCANDGFGIALDRTSRLCSPCLCSAGSPVRARGSEPSWHDRAVTPIRCRFGACGNPSACCSVQLTVPLRPVRRSTPSARRSRHPLPRSRCNPCLSRLSYCRLQRSSPRSIPLAHRSQRPSTRSRCIPCRHLLST